MGFGTNLPPATVSFLDGSFLRGEIESLNSDTLKWRHPNARQPIEFSTTNLNTVQLPPRLPPTAANAEPLCRLRFAGGDEVEGRLVALDAERFELETWFAGRLRGQRAGLASLTFFGTNQAALYEGPRAADEWKVGSGGGLIFNGPIAVPRVVPAPLAPIRAPAPAELPNANANLNPNVNAKELVAKLKDQLEKLGDQTTPVVKQALEKALKEAEALAAKAEVKLEPLPLPVPPVTAPVPAVRPAAGAERRAKELVDRLVTQLDRQGEKTVAGHLVGWEQALLDGQRLAARGAVLTIPPAPQPLPERPKRIEPAQIIGPAPAPRADPVGQAVRAEVNRVLAEAPASAKPPLPPPELSSPTAPKPAAGPAANRPFTEGDITKLTDAAERAATVAEFLKSGLVTTALAEKQTSRATLDRWFAEFEKPADWQGDAVKTARFKAMVRAEADLLGRRLLGRAAAFVELPVPVVAPGGLNEIAANAPGLAPTLRMMTDAMKAETAEAFLKSDLVKAAVDAGMASQRALERWFEDFAKPAEVAADKEKEARFKERVRAEATLLAGRLAPALAAPARVAQPPDVLNMAGAFGFGGDFQPPRAVSTGPAWTYRDGAYYSTGTGTLGRECNLPTKARVEFDMAWRGQPYFRFSFFTRSIEHYDYNDGWQFYTSASGYIYPMRRGGMGAVSVSSVRIPQMQTKSTVRLTFLLDTEKESVLLLADGEKVYEWKNLGRPGNGTGLVFYNYNSTSRIRLSNISVAPWDGSFGEPASDPDQKDAVVQFANQDRASGALIGIRDGRLAFTAAGSRLEVPVARVTAVTLPVESAPATTNPGAVHLSLHRNERLTLTLEKWEAGEVTAVSPVFGRLRLKPESVRALRFNPAAPRTSADELSWPGDHLSPRP